MFSWAHRAIAILGGYMPALLVDHSADVANVLTEAASSLFRGQLHHALLFARHANHHGLHLLFALGHERSIALYFSLVKREIRCYSVSVLAFGAIEKCGASSHGVCRASGSGLFGTTIRVLGFQIEGYLDRFPRGYGL